MKDILETEEIPWLPGAYALLLRLEEAHSIHVGRLGAVLFAAGDYFYLGSARGPGGLRARLGRHLQGDGRQRWHVDWLRGYSAVRGYAYLVGDARLECAWSQMLAELPGSGYPVAGFGSSDCRSCRAHLVRLGSSMVERAVQTLAEAGSEGLVWVSIPPSRYPVQNYECR